MVYSDDGELRYEMRHIVPGEPDAALFEPPADAVIVPDPRRVKMGRFSVGDPLP
jgi:hypothetical protein